MADAELVGLPSKHQKVIMDEHTIPVAHSTRGGEIALNSDLPPPVLASIPSEDSQKIKEDTSHVKHHLDNEETTLSAKLSEVIPAPIASEHSEEIKGEEYTGPVTHGPGSEHTKHTAELPIVVPLSIPPDDSEQMKEVDMTRGDSGSEQVIPTTDLSILVPPSISSERKEIVQDEQMSPVVHDTSFLESMPASVESPPVYDSARAAKRSSDGTKKYALPGLGTEQAEAATPMEGVDSTVEGSISHNVELPPYVHNAITADDLDVCFLGFVSNV